MFKKLRIDAGLTRQELSDATGRSVNYLLKAEQLTFPTPPIALIEYWTRNSDLNRYVLEQAYYAAQRKHRREWLNSWIPRPGDISHFSFCRKWLSVDALTSGVGAFDVTDADDENVYDIGTPDVPCNLEPETSMDLILDIDILPASEALCPSQYAVSTGLCVPASAVYFAEKYPHKPVAASVRRAVDDLVEYAQGGEFYTERAFAVGTHNIVFDLIKLRSTL